MSRFMRASLALAAAGLAVTGVAVGPDLGSAAQAKATTHTVRLAAHKIAAHGFPPNKFVQTEKDRNPVTGAVRGFDTVRGHFNVKTGVVKIDAALALEGGLITAHLTGKGHTFDGVITGGTGKYKTITGTVHAQDKGSKVTLITLKYTL